MNKVITALATPYKNGEIDRFCYEKLVNYQVNCGVDALLAVGTTAEAQLLDLCEKKLLVTTAKRLAGDIPVFVGIEGRGTKEAVLEAATAVEWGANGLLIAPPAFVKCTPVGYLRHVQEIRKIVNVPLMLYNAPSRCGYTLDQTIVKELSSEVDYFKDAGNDLDYTATVAKYVKTLCGNDFLLPHVAKLGAVGVVSVVSNVAPQLTRAVLDGQDECQLFTALAKLSMLEVSPIAIKYMLYKKGIFDSYEMRLPLTAASEHTRKLIDDIWNKNIC